MTQELSPDQKGSGSLTLGEVIVNTRHNFPDPKYRPQVHKDTPYYHIYGINPSPHSIWATADGIGTKPELAERLAAALEDTGLPDYSPFRNLAYDVIAMVESDEARFGRFVLGVTNVIDVNEANPQVISQLAQGLESACNNGGFALLNGELAELGYRVSGYGRNRINWNATAVSLVVPDKLILGENLEPGQPIVAFREEGIRSNGLSLARKILEQDYLSKQGYTSKEDYFSAALKVHLDQYPFTNVLGRPDPNRITKFISAVFGHNLTEQLLLPWDTINPQLTQDLLKPSTLYSPLMYHAQGGVDGPKAIESVAAAHISGGGIPEKLKRMVELKGLGAHIEPVFPEPKGIHQLLDIADHLNLKTPLVDDRKACENWNRGIGFAVVTPTQTEADNLIKLAQTLNYEAQIAGEIIPAQKIEFRGHTWTY